MSSALAYREPHRFFAGVLALAVHLALFCMFYFGLRWKAQSPEVFMVDMWGSLPETQNALPPVELPPPVKAEPAPAPKAVAPALPPVKGDIELREKKKKLAREKQAKEKAATLAKREKERRELEKYVARRVQEEQARVRAEEEHARQRAELDAATATQVNRYRDMIRSKIKRKIVKQDVPGTAEAEFKVTLLPDGSVLDVVLLKSSGYEAYDNAAERAIYLAQPLPLPPDEELQKMFRELRLTIRP